MRLVPGVVVGERYTLVERLGEGGYGAVWRAVGPRGHAIAIKFLHAHLGGDAIHRFQREAEILSRLKHPHCVEFHGFDPGDGHDPAWLATSFVEGQTLGDWIEQSRSTSDRLQVIRQIALALEAAHREGIVHRDLKPANIMVTPTSGGPQVTVLDFGIGKLLDDQRVDITTTGEVIGTPGYMSPEQLLGRRDIGPPADLYALGAIIFAMFEQRPVFHGDSAFGTSMMHLTEPVPPMGPHVPPSVARLVGRLLAKDPAERPAGIGAVLAVVQQPEPRPVPKRRRRLTSPVRISLVALVVIVAIAAGVLAVMWPSRSPPPSSAVRLPPTLTTSTLTSSAAQTPDGPGCMQALEPGRRRLDGGFLKVPRNYESSTEHPMIMLLHQGTEADATVLAFHDLAETKGVLIAEPQSPATAESITEFAAMVSEHACIDSERVYLVALDPNGALAGHTTLPPFAAAAGVDWALTSDALKDREYAPLRSARPFQLVTTSDGPAQPSRSELERQLGREHGCEQNSVRAGDTCRTWRCDTEFRSCEVEPGATTSLAVSVWEFLKNHRRASDTTNRPGGCGRSWEPGRHKLGGGVLYVPVGYDEALRHPLIFALHANNDSPDQMIDAFFLEKLADEHLYVIVAPRRPPRSWSSFDAPPLLRQAARDANRALCIDQARQYVIGDRGAGYFAELTREWEDIAAVVTFSHRPRLHRWEDVLDFTPRNPYLAILPIDDPREPAQGGEVVSIAANQRRLTEEHRCAPDVQPEPFEERGRNRCWRWPECGAELSICEVEGARVWPNPSSNGAIHNRVLREFLQRHRTQ